MHARIQIHDDQNITFRIFNAKEIKHVSFKCLVYNNKINKVCSHNANYIASSSFPLQKPVTDHINVFYVAAQIIKRPHPLSPTSAPWHSRKTIFLPSFPFISFPLLLFLFTAATSLIWTSCPSQWKVTSIGEGKQPRLVGKERLLLPGK